MCHFSPFRVLKQGCNRNKTVNQIRLQLYFTLNLSGNSIYCKHRNVSSFF